MIRIGSIYIQRSLLNSNALHPPAPSPRTSERFTLYSSRSAVSPIWD